MKNRVKFEEFIRRMDKVYAEIDSYDDPTIKKVVSVFTKRAKILTFVNNVLGVVISLFFCTYPFFSSKTLPYAIWIPGINVFKTPIYEILYIIQVWIIEMIRKFTTRVWPFSFQIILTAPGCHCYIPFTCFFISSTLFGIIQIKTLQHQLRNATESSRDNAEIDVKLNEFIKTQLRIVDYIKDINNLVGFICLVELLSFGLMLIALLFLLKIVSFLKIVQLFDPFFSDRRRNCSILHRLRLHQHNSVPSFRLVLAFERDSWRVDGNQLGCLRFKFPRLYNSNEAKIDSDYYASPATIGN